MNHPKPAANPVELRKFGLVVGAAFCVLGGIRWWLKGELPVTLFIIGALLVFFGAVLPVALKPVFRAWMKLAEILNWVMTRVTLSLAFYLIITPAAILYRIISGDPLKRAMDPAAATYWEAPDAQPTDLQDYKNQF